VAGALQRPMPILVCSNKPLASADGIKIDPAKVEAVQQ
jgi:hypothetical protein